MMVCENYKKFQIRKRIQKFKRQMKVSEILNYLKSIAHEYSVAVTVTNHMITDIVTGELKPTGGNPSDHIPDVRIHLKIDSKLVWRVCSLIKSADLQPGFTDVG